MEILKLDLQKFGRLSYCSKVQNFQLLSFYQSVYDLEIRRKSEILNA